MNSALYRDRKENLVEKSKKGPAYSDEYYDYHEFVIDPKQEPVRIDKFLMDRLFRVSRNRIQNAIRAGSILVNEQEVKPNFKVKPGHQILVIIPKPPGEGVSVVPEQIPLEVLYEDEAVLIVNKRAGMVVHPGVGHYRQTLVNALAYYFQNHDLPVMKGNNADKIGLVHRIDKNTSGLLVVAKTEYAMNHLAKQFYHHTIQRKYVALVWGEPEADEGTISGHIGRHPKNRLLRTCFADGSQGKWAVTHYKVLERLYYVSLVECQLETGRTHQIRVHMQHAGHPLFNDERYGGDQILKGTIYSKYKQFVQNCFATLPRHGLHARSLGFEHPLTGEQVYFESPLPEDFQNCLQRWRTYVSDRKSKNNGIDL
ncbi:MAG: RluA family pseudouridine synthase [Saprospiraceae bacterium]|nr:RluA family pseudouridine synthase [Saprospiraceae bacterium]MCB0625510.1 RluA family pseudouridine synthase [Saprospiraceae bacterium]MCB0677568.1 RluA family pseudouridine synthase [Saprospiraceae bacterium]MCB0679404.1 RluA family pseudouridine synthase [Saprospiraceae bacterium]